MKHLALTILTFLVLAISLQAVMQPLSMITPELSKNDKLRPEAICLYGDYLYLVDNAAGLAKLWSISKNRILKSELLGLPKKAKITDICRDEKNLYLLNAKTSSILIYTPDGYLLRELKTKGSPMCEFKAPIGIAVNYQGYIYVLDSGRKELLSFTNEGMFLGKLEVAGTIGMSLGLDQKIRILRTAHKSVWLDVVDQDLRLVTHTLVRDLNPKDQISDICVNDYGEVYLINAKKTQVGKLKSDGQLDPRAYYGSRSKVPSKNSFLFPVSIKCQTGSGNDVIAVLDKGHRAVKLFVESDLPSGERLEKPEYTMRPELIEAKSNVFIDYTVADSLIYLIRDGVNANNKKSRQLLCRKEGGKSLLSIYAVDFKSIGVKSFDALAIYKDKVYILDRGAHRVHIFNRFSGDYTDSFGDKGKGNGAFRKPGGIAASRDGYIFVADTENQRLSIWTEYGAYHDKLDLKRERYKPRQLRTDERHLYLLSNQGNLSRINLNDIRGGITPIAKLSSISSFELLYDGRIGIVDGNRQQLIILAPVFDRGLETYVPEHRMLAYKPNGQFPFFSEIRLIRYNPNQKSLFISQTNQQYLRELKFFSSPNTPEWFRITVNDQGQADLVWDMGKGIEKWQVFGITAEADTVFHIVSQPNFTVAKPQSRVISYQVAAFSEDNKLGAPTALLPDYFSYGRYLAETKNYSEAIRAYENAYNLERSEGIKAQIYSTLIAEAQYLNRIQEYEAALLSLGKAHELEPKTLEPVLLSIQTYIQMGAYKAGIKYVNTLDPEHDPQLLERKIGLLYLDQDYPAVIADGNIYQKKYGEDLDVLSFMSLAYERRGDPDTALALTRSVVALKPSYEDHLRISELLLYMKQYDSAIANLQRMLTIYLNEPGRLDSAYDLLGLCYYRKQEYGLAADYAEQAVKLNPGSAGYHYNLAEIYSSDRKPLEALTHYREAYALNPVDYDLGFTYAKALSANNNLDEALIVLDQINRSGGIEDELIEFNLFYADLLASNQRYDDAYRQIELALKQNPYDPQLRAKHRELGTARDNANLLRKPLEIARTIFDPLFPSLKEYYRTHPIGRVEIFNTRNECIQNVSITVIIPNITNSWIEQKNLSVLANSTLSVDVFATLNSSIFTLARGNEQDLDVEVRLEYIFDYKDYADKANFNLHILKNQAMKWSERKQLGCFVNPDDINLHSFVANTILPSFSGITEPPINKNLLHAMQIYDFYRANDLQYLADPNSSVIMGMTIDHIQYPFQTLELKRGDCDDLLVLLAASLSVIGIETGFLDLPGHVILVFDSGMDAAAISKAGFSMEHFILRDQKYWIPLETTLVDKDSFYRSWLFAIASYQEIFDQGVLPDLIRFSESHLSHPPVTFSGVPNSGKFSQLDQARSYYAMDAQNIMLLSQITIEEEFIKTLERYPGNLRVKNQYALWSLEQNKPENALRLWREILKTEPENFSALVNLGNLQLSQKKYDEARANYQLALKADKQKDNLYRNLCVLEYRRGNLSKAREYYTLIKDKAVLSKLNPSMYSDLLGAGEQR